MQYSETENIDENKNVELRREKKNSVASFKVWKDAFVELFERDMRENLGSGEHELGKDPLEGGVFGKNPVLRTFFENRDKIDRVIEEVVGKKIHLISPVERNILRISASCIILGNDIPLAVKNSLRLSDKFGSSGASKFIHVAVSKMGEKLKKD